MSNRKTMLEIHQKEILDFIREYGSLCFGIEKNTGEIIHCDEIYYNSPCLFHCNNCDNDRKNWLNSFEQEEVEIDIKKYIGWDVRVSDTGEHWVTRKLLAVLDKPIKDRFITENWTCESSFVPWKYCKPLEEKC